MKTWISIILAFASTYSVFASEMRLAPVGDFGGYRVWTSCSFPGGLQGETCILDTGSNMSITFNRTGLPSYPSEGHATVFQDSPPCQVISVDGFTFSGLDVSPLHFILCPEFKAIAPAIALIGRDVLGESVFRLLFSSLKITWAGKAPMQTNPLSRDEGWLNIKGSIGGKSVKIGFDTGTPVTMISESWYSKNKDLFQDSPAVTNPALHARGMTPYKLKGSIDVGGVKLISEYVYVVSPNNFATPESIDLELGANHMMKADWFFDLKNNRWRIDALTGIN